MVTAVSTLDLFLSETDLLGGKSVRLWLVTNRY